jgi:hypothetical protein
MIKLFKAIKRSRLGPFFLFFIKLIPDRIFLKYQYYHKTGKKLNLKNLVLYNEKLQWLKLYYRRPEYTVMADKYMVKEYIAKTIGPEYSAPLLGVWESFDEIPFDKLPEQFILKATHDSGGFLICQNKKTLDYVRMRDFFNKHLSINWYWHSREWAYKNIKPRIIAEKLLTDESGNELRDYKIFCFNGEPKIIQVDFDKSKDWKRNFYSPDWKYLPFSLKYPTAPLITIKKPKSLALMLDLAKKLSADLPHARVDFYNTTDGRIYFGECTFYNYAGYELFNPPEWDKIFGDWLTLPRRNFLEGCITR